MTEHTCKISRAPSELVSVDHCLTATGQSKTHRPSITRRQGSRDAEAEMLTGLHFGLDFAAKFGKRDPRPMWLGRSLVAARRQPTDTRSVERERTRNACGREAKPIGTTRETPIERTPRILNGIARGGGPNISPGCSDVSHSERRATLAYEPAQIPRTEQKTVGPICVVRAIKEGEISCPDTTNKA